MGDKAAALANEVMARLREREDLMLWKNNTGVARSMDGRRTIRFGIPGAPDWLGVREVPITEDMIGQTFGLAVGLELKSENDRQSDQQKLFQTAFERRGGLYILARKAEDVWPIG
jgi:ribosomal protein L5